MPLHGKPENFESEKLISDIDRMVAAVDAMVEARVIGGEPMINPQYHRIIDRLSADPKIKKVVIYTNGTIVLRAAQIPAFQNKK